MVYPRHQQSHAHRPRHGRAAVVVLPAAPCPPVLVVAVELEGQPADVRRYRLDAGGLVELESVFLDPGAACSATAQEESVMGRRGGSVLAAT